MNKKFMWILICIIMMSMMGCKYSGKRRFESENLTLFDTVTKLTGYADSREEFDRLSGMIYDQLWQYHQLYDIYHNYEGIQNLKTINDQAGKMPVRVDKRVIDLLLFSRDQYRSTDGEVNIALGAVLKIWHDYRTRGLENEQEASLPSRGELLAAAQHTDIDKMIIDEAASTVYLADPDMSLDVGAVGKGYAAEQAGRFAARIGLVSGVLNLGGNVRTIGGKVDQSPWNVGVRNPARADEGKPLLTVKLAGQALVTSGNYERYYTVGGKRYHHIIDKDTLMPADYYTSVSIISNDSGVADALSTAVFNMPLESGKKLINSMQETEAVWILPDGEIQYSDHFVDFIRNKNQY